jgi:HB1/ASXL restriction endonuclease-like protein with HTH domain
MIVYALAKQYMDNVSHPFRGSARRAYPRLTSVRPFRPIKKSDIKDMTKELSWNKAIEKVLSDAPSALHYKEITDKIISDGHRKNLGATPAATVRSLLATGVTNRGSDCPFRKVGRGLYEWRRDGFLPTQTTSLLIEEEDEPQYEIITSFGMFWRKDAIDWVSTPRITHHPHKHSSCHFYPF